MSKIKKASSPTLTELDAPPLEADSTQLKRTAGPIARVLYIARAARPDVAYAVSRLARRATRWTEPCERELTRLMSYLMSTASDRLTSQVAETDMSSIHIEVATDADLAGDKFSARSTTGVFASLVGRSRDDPNKESCRVPLVWSSRMQTSVSDSTAEAELTAAHNGVKLVEPYRLVLESLFQRPIGLRLLVDNAAAVRLYRAANSRRQWHMSRGLRGSTFGGCKSCWDTLTRKDTEP